MMNLANFKEKVPNLFHIREVARSYLGLGPHPFILPYDAMWSALLITLLHTPYINMKWGYIDLHSAVIHFATRLVSAMNESVWVSKGQLRKLNTPHNKESDRMKFDRVTYSTGFRITLVWGPLDFNKIVWGPPTNKNGLKCGLVF
jgi:hypothetical protein